MGGEGKSAGSSYLVQLLARNRRTIAEQIPRDPEIAWFSPVMALQQQEVLPFVIRHAKGRLLDVGAGTVPFRAALGTVVNEYRTLDIERRVDHLDFLGDLQDLRGVIDEASFDTVMALEVLEHVPDTRSAISEMYRVLAPGGTALVSVPHLSRLHEEPHDYYRFTAHGLIHLFTQAGFECLEVQPYGGILSFLVTRSEPSPPARCGRVHGLRPVILHLNKWLISKPAIFCDAC